MLQAKRSQVFAVTLRARFGCAHAWKNVLLNGDPPLITTCAQPGRYRGEVNVPLAKLAKHSVPHRRIVVPLLPSRLLRYLRVAVLEMHMPDPVGKPVKPCQHFGAVVDSGAVCIM